MARAKDEVAICHTALVALAADLEVSKEKKFGPVQQPLGVVSGRVGETWQETMATTRKKKLHVWRYRF